MQDYDWNSLKTLLAVRRAGSLAGAGGILGVDETTVSRRLKALENAAGMPLFRRQHGRYQPEGAASSLFEFAEQMDRRSLAMVETIRRHTGALVGTVRVSAVPFIVNRVLVPALGKLSKMAPDVTLDLVAETRNTALERNEADIALRLARPAKGGLDIQARRIGSITFCACAPAHSNPIGWVTYDAPHAHLPQARAMDRLMKTADPALRVSDLESAIEAVATGVGCSVLPERVANSDQRLRRFDVSIDLPTRQVWLLTLAAHPDRKAVSTVKRWLSEIAW